MNLRHSLLTCTVGIAAFALLLTCAVTTFRQLSSATRGADSVAAALLCVPSATLPVLHALLSP